MPLQFRPKADKLNCLLSAIIPAPFFAMPLPPKPNRLFPVLMTAICGQSEAKFQSKTWSINSLQIEQQPLQQWQYQQPRKGAKKKENNSDDGHLKDTFVFLLSSPFYNDIVSLLRSVHNRNEKLSFFLTSEISLFNNKFVLFSN